MSEKLNIQDVASLLAAKWGTTKKEAENFLREFFDTLHETLFDEQLVKVKNLGTFKLTQVSDRESVDVVTGQRVVIPAHYKINFSPDNALADAINEPFSLFETTEIEGDIEEIPLIVEPILNPIIEVAPEPDNTPVEPVLNPMIEVTPEPDNTPVEPIIQALNTIQPLEMIEEEKNPTKEELLITEELPEIKNQPVENTIEPKVTEQEEEPIFVPDSDYDFPSVEYEDEDLPWWKRFGIWNIIFITIALLLVAALVYLLWNDNLGRIIPQKEQSETLTITSETPVNLIDTIADTLPKDTLVNDEINVDSLSLIPEEKPKEELKIQETPKEEPKIQETPKEKPVVTTPEKPKEKPVVTKPETTEKDSNTDSGRKHTVKSGETLRIIALNEYGNKAFWVYIYEENKSRITNPNNVGMGMQLTLPSANKYGIDANDPASIQKAINRGAQVK